ncbi:holo-ACP synthase [Amnibacterium sp.]|uniref:holo-ACP synthase n=1 Tax=Amnibacterium sp. TaxID=1872496 RepID=UPI003F7C4D0B
MILGIGVDVVDIARFGRSLERTPPLRDRLFARSERDLPLSSLAARFAAKEALIKAAGDSNGFTWHDMVVKSDPSRRPRLVTSGEVATRLALLGVTSTHLSLSHDAGIASAFVVLEG